MDYQELQRQFDKLLGQYNELVLDNAQTKRDLAAALSALEDASKLYRHRRQQMDPAFLYTVREHSRFGSVS